MAGSIFKETLHRHWRQIIYWGLGIALLIVYVTIVVGDSSVLETFNDVIEKMPPALMEMFGMNMDTIGTIEGYLAFGVFTYTAIILAVYGVIAGLGVTANEEDAGISDVLLSLPVARWRVIVEKLAAYTVMLLGIVAIDFAAMTLTMRTTTYNLDMGNLFQSFLNLVPFTLLIMVFTAFVATLVRGRNTAGAITAAFVIASYFVDSLGGLLGGAFADVATRFSIFYYLDAEAVLRSGLVWANVIGLLAVAGLLAAGSVWAFDRRDVGV